jgi:hypothetical protein
MEVYGVKKNENNRYFSYDNPRYADLAGR